MDVTIETSWKAALQEEFEKPYFAGIKSFLQAEKANGHIVYPASPLIFNAFNTTPFDAVKVVILGQDPYHGPGQAHGLSFSVPDGIKPPPSLVNIFKEQHKDLGLEIPSRGNLTSWAEQGVLLLNACLTVRAKIPGSHKKSGWQTFTDAVIKTISDRKERVVFLLWGRFAQSKSSLINTEKHLVLMAAHPSPFSAHSGFFGCGHFSRTNEYLQIKGENPINWNI